MTILEAARMTGYLVLRVDAGSPSQYQFVAAWEDGRVVASHRAKTPHKALKGLCDAVLEIHKREVLKRADWHCEKCGSLGPLQIHHVKFRSHGGTHKAANLLAECIRCHNAEHGIKVA